jgi:phosphopantothenoylcysteine decarboxylase/phosphopantothenate--cysteine ligase
MLSGKKIILGVSASIAAYKSAILVRLLVKAGAEVRVVMTPASKDFITPLTLSTLSKHSVVSEFSSTETGDWNNHVELALWADLFVIAPASANTLSKMCSGVCDNLLMAVYLSARCPVYFAPAMDLDMYNHATTKENLFQLKKRGQVLLNPGTGELASGLSGEGRMAEPEEIISLLEQDLLKKAPLAGLKALVTAGPTYEAIDPVRFIGNHSSGKMGFALAEELAAQGASVTLVCGPNALTLKNSVVSRIDVVSAEDMYLACLKQYEEADMAVLAAAVADFRPKSTSKSKIKKQSNEVPQIELEQTPDILAELGRRKKVGQLLVGFALETDSETEHAKSKLSRKNLDFIVLNSLRDAGAGFGTDTNKITIIDKNNNSTIFELKDKASVAKDIVAKMIVEVVLIKTNSMNTNNPKNA